MLLTHYTKSYNKIKCSMVFNLSLFYKFYLTAVLQHLGKKNYQDLDDIETSFQIYIQSII